MFSHTRYKELLGLRTLNRYERTPEWYNKLAAAERPLFLQDVATDWMKDWVGLSDDEKKPFVAEAQKIGGMDEGQCVRRRLWSSVCSAGCDQSWIGRGGSRGGWRNRRRGWWLRGM